jgi:hypothetical protein
MTFSTMPLIINTFGTMTGEKMSVSRLTLRRMTLRRMTLRRMTLSRMLFSRMTLRIMKGSRMILCGVIVVKITLTEMPFLQGMFS